MRICIIIVSLFVLVGCQQQRKESEIKVGENFKTITIKESDISDEAISSFLELATFIPLSDEELIGNIRKILIEKDRIFILDDSPKILVFDMLGKLLYAVDQKGGGPGEFANIADFSLNEEKGELVLLDIMKDKLLFYNIANGKYLSDKPIKTFLPQSLAIVDNVYYYGQPDNYRFPIQKDNPYFLFRSNNGVEITEGFLQQNAIASFNFHLGTPFFYNERDLYYNTSFDSFVYQLTRDKVSAIYEINLPNQLPMKEIEAKIAPSKLLESAYSYGLRGIFEANKVLHFTFSKEGFFITCFYDVEKDELLYCGKRPLIVPTDKFPFYSIVEGVYKNQFFTAVSPSRIAFLKENYPNDFPKDLLNDIDKEDNPIIAFFKVVK